MRHVAAVLLREANAVSDNPLVFADQGEVLSDGMIGRSAAASFAINDRARSW